MGLVARGREAELHGTWPGVTLSVTEEEEQESHAQQSNTVKWVMGKHASENPTKKLWSEWRARPAMLRE